MKQGTMIHANRSGTAAELAALNPQVREGEIIVESDTGKTKVGRAGNSTRNSLPYSGVSQNATVDKRILYSDGNNAEPHWGLPPALSTTRDDSGVAIKNNQDGVEQSITLPTVGTGGSGGAGVVTKAQYESLTTHAADTKIHVPTASGSDSGKILYANGSAAPTWGAKPVVATTAAIKPNLTVGGIISGQDILANTTLDEIITKLVRTVYNPTINAPFITSFSSSTGEVEAPTPAFNPGFDDGSVLGKNDVSGVWMPNDVQLSNATGILNGPITYSPAIPSTYSVGDVSVVATANYLQGPMPKDSDNNDLPLMRKGAYFVTKTITLTGKYNARYGATSTIDAGTAIDTIAEVKAFGSGSFINNGANATTVLPVLTISITTRSVVICIPTTSTITNIFDSVLNTNVVGAFVLRQTVASVYTGVAYNVYAAHFAVAPSSQTTYTITITNNS